MANTLANFNIAFAARMALMWLKNKKGIVRSVSRQAETERQASWEQGQFINLRRSTLFGPADDHVPGTGTTAEDIKGQNVQINLDKHKEKKFTITDRELAYSTERLINEHIGPAADRVADAIEQDIYGLGHLIGPHALANQANAQDVILAARRVLYQNQTPMDENIICAVDPSLEEKFLASEIFHAARTTGDGANQQALDGGLLGRRFGVNFFSSQLAQRLIGQQSGTIAAATGGGDMVGAANASYDVNTDTVVIKALTNSETLSPNVDTIKFAGDPTVYRAIAGSGAGSGTVGSNLITLTLFPALRKPLAEDTVATFGQRETIQDAAAGTRENLMFHREALALAMAPLPAIGDGMGARIATVVDDGPDGSGLSLRLRMWYEGGPSKINCAIDALYGVKVLNPMLAVRMLRPQ